MCGIAGFCNLSRNSFFIDEVLLEKMQNTMVHRGPDGYRTWMCQKNQIGLVHRRLSIIDLSQAAFQPMTDEQSSVIVCCNGEIYNHPELRKELEGYGHRYKTNSDTETIVHAYKQWGIDCLHKFEGMFAIVIFDRIKNELYLVRDRIGIKPCYFSVQGGVLSFASEIKALWQLPWIEKKINATALYHYLTFLATPAPMTLYEGVYKLPSSFYLKVDAQRTISFHEWYTPIVCTENQNDLHDEQFCIEKIRTLLRESIQKRMRSDVPFGVFLSGGIDSSLNVALMSECTDNVKTFNVSFADGPEFSEVEWARKVSNHFGTDHHEIVITEKEAFDFFEKMVHHQDEPIGDCVCIPLYYVSKLLKDAGVTVVQAGEGADELFCGYDLYAQYLNWSSLLRKTQTILPQCVRRTGAGMFAHFFPHRGNKIELLHNWANNRSLFWSGATAFTETMKRKKTITKKQGVYDPMIEKIYPGFVQDADSHVVAQYHLKKLKTLDPQADFLKQMTYLELKQRLPELLLMRVDKMTMATSVEGRVPFLDHKLVEFALQVPKHLKYKNGETKYILKKACEGILPHNVIYRKKMGFAAPTNRWFEGSGLFSGYFQNMLHNKPQWREYLNFGVIQNMVEEHRKGVIPFSDQIWAIQNVMGYDVKQT